MKLVVALAISLLTPFALHGQDLGIEVGARPPAATVESLDGKPVDLGAWVGKSPVLI